MAIKEFSTADLNTISRTNSVSNVLEKINGVTVGNAISTPAVAYSVRLLGSAVGISSYTGPAMRVRRDTAGGTGHDDEADIAFDTSLTDPTISLDSAISNASAGVTATTLGQFLNVGTVGGTTYTNPDSLTVTASCYVDTWYDQAGSNDAEQATQGNQPQIHDGTVNTDLITENGKPAVEFLATSTTFLSYADNTGLDSLRTGALSYIACAKLDTRQSWQQIFGTSGSSTDGEGSLGLQFFSNTSNKFGPHNTFIAVTSVATLTLTSETNRMLVGMYRNGAGSGGGNGATVTLHATDSSNNTHTAAGTQVWTSQSGNNIYIGKQGDLSQTGNNSWVGTIQEIILWPVDQDDAGNRPAIETNINGFFGIY